VRPSIDIYIVKLEGRKDAVAWNMPGLKATIMRKNRPILGLSVRQIAAYSLIWQAAQTMARKKRIA
jgi:hypothetical protein